ESRSVSFGESALGGGDATLVRVDRDRFAERPGERLEGGLDHVVGVRARADPDVERHPRVVGDRAEELLGELRVEAGDADLREGAVESTVGPAGDVEGTFPKG